MSDENKFHLNRKMGVNNAITYRRLIYNYLIYNKLSLIYRKPRHFELNFHHCEKVSSKSSFKYTFISQKLT